MHSDRHMGLRVRSNDHEVWVGLVWFMGKSDRRLMHDDSEVNRERRMRWVLLPTAIASSLAMLSSMGGRGGIKCAFSHLTSTMQHAVTVLRDPMPDER
jgi:hypothetical protein